VLVVITLSEERYNGWTHSSVYQLEYYLDLQFLSCILVPHNLSGSGVAGYEERDHC
jgi:hypothetical protein